MLAGCTRHRVAGVQELAPAPLPSGGPLPARHSLPPGRQALLQQALSRLSYWYLPLKLRQQCVPAPPPPPPVSHFQTGQLVWFEPSADLPAGGGQPGEAAAGGVGGQACSSREETRQVFLLV